MIIKLPSLLVGLCGAMLMSFLLASCSDDDITVSRSEVPLVGFASEESVAIFSRAEPGDKIVPVKVRLTQPATTDVKVSLEVNGSLSSADNMTDFRLVEENITISKGEILGETSMMVFAASVDGEEDEVSLRAVINISNVEGNAAAEQLSIQKTVQIVHLILQPVAIPDHITFPVSTPWSGLLNLDNSNRGDIANIALWAQSVCPNPDGIDVVRRRLETYGKAVIGEENEEGSILLTMLNEGDLIGPESNWETGRGDCNVDGFISMPTIDYEGYQAWRGQTAYAGIQFPNKDISTLIDYGWLEIRVSADGSKAEILRAAYRPQGAIKAGQTQ